MAQENRESIIISLLDEIKTSIKNLKTPQVPQIDFAKIDNLTDKLEQATDSITDCIGEVGKLTEQVQQPLKTEHRHTFDIRSSWAFVSLTILTIISISAIGVLIHERAKSNHLRDNDLKYRYIKMKGEATPTRISELEDFFEINRDNAKIKQLRKDVEDFERAIKEKATLDEQTRIRQLEADKLNDKAKILKEK